MRVRRVVVLAEAERVPRVEPVGRRVEPLAGRADVHRASSRESMALWSVDFSSAMRVLDFGQWRPAPYATQLLADLGAEVLKVEPPGGDPMRAFPEIFATVAGYKRSVVLDLKDPTGPRPRARARRRGRRRRRGVATRCRGAARCRVPTTSAPSTRASCTARCRGSAGPVRWCTRRVTT